METFTSWRGLRQLSCQQLVFEFVVLKQTNGVCLGRKLGEVNDHLGVQAISH